MTNWIQQMRRVNLKRSVCLLISALLLRSMALSDTITLTPIADTSIFEEVPNNNLGGLSDVPAGTIRVRKKSRALFKFDVSQIPASASITSVSLTLQVVKTPPSGVASIFDLHRVLRDWGEGTGAAAETGSPATAGQATWINRFHPSTPWSPAGGGAGVDYAAAVSGSHSMNGLGSYVFASTP